MRHMFFQNEMVVPPSWPEANQTKTVDDRSSCFGMKELAYGPSIIYANVKINGQND
jgi:hypothetical protein